MKRGVTLTTLFLLVGGVALGQVKAQQGVVAKQGPTDERKTFKSPMILEVPITAYEEMRKVQVGGDKSTWKRQSLQGLADYVCSGVSIQELVFYLKGANSKGEAKLTVIATLFTEKGVDKLVNLTFEVLSKGKPVATALVKKIDAEETKKTSADTKLTIPVAKLDPVETPTLRITMQVVDNP